MGRDKEKHAGRVVFEDRNEKTRRGGCRSKPRGETDVCIRKRSENGGSAGKKTDGKWKEREAKERERYGKQLRLRREGGGGGGKKIHGDATRERERFRRKIRRKIPREREREKDRGCKMLVVKCLPGTRSRVLLLADRLNAMQVDDISHDHARKICVPRKLKFVITKIIYVQ